MINPFNVRSRLFYIPLILGGLVATFFLIGIIFDFLSRFSSIFTILLMAWIITIILSPVVSYLKKSGIADAWAIAISFIALFILLVLLGLFVIPSLYQELNVLTQHLSQVNVSTFVNNILESFHIRNINVDTTIISHLDQFITYLVNNIFGYIQNAFSVFFDLVLAFFFAFYFLYDGATWRQKLYTHVPEHWKGDFTLIANSINEGVQGFIKGQTIAALIVAILTMIIMKILGLNLILVAGLYMFLSMYIPVIGPIIGPIVPLIIALTNSFTAFAILLVILVLMTNVVYNILQPRIFSKSLGLHPILVILSVLVGVQLFGIAGALLALPVASIIQSLLIHYYKG